MNGTRIERDKDVTTDGLWRGRLKRLRGWARAAVPFASGVFAALAALLLYSVLIPGAPAFTARDVDATVARALASATPPPALSVKAYQAIMPSLVLIQAQSPGANGREEDSLGSGTVIDDAGDILTSLHVVEGAEAIQLTFADGTRSRAIVAIKQPETDIAVLRPVQLPPQLVPAVLGNPGAVQVGDEAFAAGSPFGLYGSMSAGIISGLNRSFRPESGSHQLQGLIQIDAAVNPGNSGGPLVNRDGQVIGVIVGLINPTKENVFIGIGLAVPIDVAGGAMGSPVD